MDPHSHRMGMGMVAMGVPVPLGMGGMPLPLVTPLMLPEFPNNAKEALQQLDQMYGAVVSQKRLWNRDGVSDLVNTHVFSLPNPRDLKSSRLTTVQKLGLSEILVAFFDSYADKKKQVQEDLFNTVFYTAALSQGDVPLQILSSVTSLAIAFECSSLLHTIGRWTLTAGPHSEVCMYIAADVTKDLIMDEKPEKYDSLPRISSLYTGSLLLSIALSYRTASPPRRLVHQVVKWIQSTPEVCFVPPKVAVFDLFRWVVVSDEEESELHFAILFAVERVGVSGGGGREVAGQTLPGLMTVVQDLRVKWESVKKGNHLVGNGGSRLSVEKVQNDLDRLLQLAQLFVARECLSSSEIRPLLGSLEESGLPLTSFYHHVRGVYL